MMTIATLFVAASPAVALGYEALPKYEARPGSQVFRVGEYIYDGLDPSRPVLLDADQQFVDADDFLSSFVTDHNLQELMPKARAWVADEFYSDHPKTLQVLRLKAGLTQGGLAKLTNEPQSSISRLESGIESPSIDRASRMAKALNVSLDDYYSALNETRKGA